MTYSVAVIGTGADPDDPDREGFAMAYRHAVGYKHLDSCELIACADIVRENAEAFAGHFDVNAVYEDYMEMLEAEKPEVVSVCVPPSVHAEIVIACAESGIVEAIHCEKPMATMWADCRQMEMAARDNNIQLTFNHQRRFGKPFREAKSLLDNGRIGSLQRIEIGGPNLFDFGSHLFDLSGYYTNQTPIEWVLGQVDYRHENLWFGVHNENQAIAQWRYENGVFGVASTGIDSTFSDSWVHLVGSDGALKIGPDGKPPLRMKVDNSPGWETVETGRDQIHGPSDYGRIGNAVRSISKYLPLISESPLDTSSYTQRGIEEIIRSLETDQSSELSVENALQTTEIIFAIWESSRTRGRVEMPLTVSDNPLEEMVNSGALNPE